MATKKRAIGWYWTRTEDGGVVHHGAIFALGGRPVVLRDESPVRHRHSHADVVRIDRGGLREGRVGVRPRVARHWNPPPTVRA